MKESDRLTLEARFFGDDIRSVVFNEVSFTYVEARWTKQVGADGFVQSSMVDSARLEVSGLPASICGEEWNHIFFKGPGEKGREILSKHETATGVVRFVLR